MIRPRKDRGILRLIGRKPIVPIVSLMAFAAGLAGCSAPFSEFQDARTVGKGGWELSGNYSGVFVNDTKLQDQFGAQGAFGITDDVDFRARYERIDVEDSDSNPFEVYGFGPKISIRRDRQAIYLPIGFATGHRVSTKETWEAHPMMLFTKPLGPGFDWNSSIKVMIPLASGGADPRGAINVGFGIGPADRRFVFRPEAGMMVYFNNFDNLYYHAGIGVSLARLIDRSAEGTGTVE